MSIASIGSAWRTNERSVRQGDHDIRTYLDFRGKDYPDIARDTRNFIDRGDCESTDLPGARGEIGSYTGTSAARSSDFAHQGEYSIKHTGNGVENYVAFMDSASTTDLHGILPGETVEVVCWVYIPTTGGPTAATEISLNVFHYDGGWTETVVQASVKDQWEKLTQRVTLGDADTGFLARTEIDAVHASGEFYYIDDVQVTRYPTFSLAREDNLIDRGNCESTTLPGILGETGIFTGTSAARSDEQARSGTYSIKHVTDGVAERSLSFTDNNATNDLHGIIPGETLECEAWVYIPSSGGPQVSEVTLNLFYRDGGAWTETIATATTQDAWERLAVTATIPTTAVGFILRTEILIAASATEYIYVDDVIIRRHSVPGTHYLSGGHTEHLVTLPDTGTIQVKFKPNFAYNTADNPALFGWILDSTHQFLFFYRASTDKFEMIWEDAASGAGEDNMRSAQYDDGTTYRNINQWITMTFAWDLSAGDVSTGSSLWMNKTQDDTAWSGNIVARVTTFNKLNLRRTNATPGDYDIAYVRMFPNYVATDADVQNDFKNVKNEEIYLSFDGHATGKTRVNVTRYIKEMAFDRFTADDASGKLASNKAAILLHNNSGEFSDDQNAAYDPTSDQFNGTDTEAQNYLQKQNRLSVESWYSGDFDTRFVGHMTGGYVRDSVRRGVGMAAVAAGDHALLLARKRMVEAHVWEDIPLVDSVESNSLLHVLARLGRPTIKQYLANNSFEAATITDGWAVTSGTLNKDTGESLFGGASAEVIAGGATLQLWQRIDFTGTEKLSVGQTYTFYVWCKSAASASDANNKVELGEYKDGAFNGENTSETYVLAGGEGWVIASVSHTVAASDSNQLYCGPYMPTGQTVNFDGAMLIQGHRALDLFRESSLSLNDAASANTVSADNADALQWDVWGYDVDTVPFTHPWRRIERGQNLWGALRGLANGIGAIYFGPDEAGTFRSRSPLTTDFTEPEPRHVITSGTDVMEPIHVDRIERINRVIYHGVHIQKSPNTLIMWDARAGETFDGNVNNRASLNETVANGATWPTTTPYWATYGEHQYGVTPMDDEEEETEVDEGMSDLWLWFRAPFQVIAQFVRAAYNLFGNQG